VCKGKLRVLVALAVLALCAQRAGAADDASAGYRTIRPSLVKVWAFDASGRPTASGTGLIVASGQRRSEVLTASHVIAGAAAIRIDVGRDLHDLPAHVERGGPRDLTLLAIDRGGLQPARFAPATRMVVEGNVVAVAGYVKNDELIGVAGQEPRVLFPGTVSSRPEDGAYLELGNLHVEEGLSGGPVFDPVSGAVLGILTSRTSDARGGFADSGAAVVLPFLGAAHVAVDTGAPAPRAVAAAPALAALPVLAAQPVLAAPAAATDIAQWQAGDAAPGHFTYTSAGCITAVDLSVRTLQFVVAHRALVPPHRAGALLAIALRTRLQPGAGCASAVAASDAQASYEATAMSFDGRHVTMRFTFAGDPADASRFPSDASLDADLDGNGSTATVQFFAPAWNGALALPLVRTPLAAVSSGW
jgi:hypothetical protein